MEKHVLSGTIIKAIKIASDKKALLFETDKGNIIAKCDADCCSYTWVEHIELPFRGFPCKVISVENIDMTDLGDLSDCDVVAYYGVKIVTDKGDIIIDYRNNSNGYYGGSLVWPGEYFYGGVYNQNDSNLEWISIGD